MRALAAIAAFSLLAGCATTSSIPPDIPGAYDAVWERTPGHSRALPTPDGWGFRMDVMPDGTWELFDLAFSPFLARGSYSVEGNEGGCIQLHFRPYHEIDATWPAELCEGELVLEQNDLKFSVWSRGVMYVTGSLRRGTPTAIGSTWMNRGGLLGDWMMTLVFEKHG